MAVKKGILAPKIDTPGITGFLLWARRDAKPLYSALVKKFPEVWNFEEQMKNFADPEAGMAGIWDVLSSIGSSVAGAAGSIGSFVMKNGSSIFAAGATAYVANQQAKAASAQARLALAGRPPAQVAYTTDPQTGQIIPVPVTGAGGGYSSYYGAGSSGGIMATLARVPLTTWLIGAGALGTLLLLKKRRG
jgi:hypothetical protein